MTIIVWDGEHVVVDGKISYRDKVLTESVATTSHLKIKLFKRPLIQVEDNCKITFTAFAACGNVQHAEALFHILQNITNNEESSVVDSVNKARLSFNRILRCNAHLFGVIENTETNKIKPYYWKCFVMDQGGTVSRLLKRQVLPEKGFIADGSGLLRGKAITKDILQDAVEYASFACLSNPESCGGLLTRYNPLTKVLDHPPHTAKDRLLTIVNEIETKEIQLFTEKNKKLRDTIKELT